MGCHGALNGLRVAHAFAAADPEAIVLVCAVELCTLHHQYGWDPQQIVANALFADGAAAVVGRAPSGEKSDAELDAPGPRSLVASASFVIPETEEMMTWNVRDAGFEMSLSPEVPGIITRFLPPVLAEFLALHQLSPADISSWGIHPGGPRILTATAEAAGLSDIQLEPSVSVLRRFGNMSSATILFILRELQQAKSPAPCVLLGFGPGLNVEMAPLQ